jgi:hypothetical protein
MRRAWRESSFTGNLKDMLSKASVSIKARFWGTWRDVLFLEIFQEICKNAL